MLKKVKFHSHGTFIFLNKSNMIFSKANLFKLKKALLSLEEISTKEGIVLITDTDNLTVGLEVFVDGDEGLEPTPDGEYTVGESIVTVEGGKIVSIVEKPIEQPVETVVEETPMEEQPKEEPMEEQPTEQPTEEPTISTDELNAIIEEQKSVIEGLKAEIETIKSENEELKKKLEEPAAQSAEEDFKNQKPNENEKKIDFSKYIKRNK